MPIDRYHRQTLLPQIGAEGQQRISQARVLLIGCGALGTVIADQLVRAGVGMLRIVDRDLVELTNLQRQVLFDEIDAREHRPKAIAAAERLRAINSATTIDPRVTDVASDNIESLLEVDGGQVDLILDGTDNIGTRYLINDVAVKHDVPWVYGACVGVEGRAMPIVPGETACLRCIFPNPPSAGELPTCDTAGVLGSVSAIVASLQVIAALKILLRETASGFVRVDGWDARFGAMDICSARRADCPTCGLRRFEFLDAPSSRGAALCGQNAVQIKPTGAMSLSLEALSIKLDASMEIQRSPFLLRCRVRDEPSIELSIFPDGRAIVHGTSELSRARSLYARFIGS